MKILKRRLTAATSNDKDKWPQCSFCGEKRSLTHYTEGMKSVCSSCIEKNGGAEYVDEV